MNSDHTHFIIIREQPISSISTTVFRRKPPVNDTGEKQLEKLIDSAQSATNKFRDEFEKFLYQETLQAQSTYLITTTGTKKN